MRRLMVVAGVLALAACDTAVRRDETASVDYGPKPARWRGAEQYVTRSWAARQLNSKSVRRYPVSETDVGRPR